MDFGRNLKTMRTIRNLTQAELAELAFTSRPLISLIETGEILPSPDLKARLRKVLDWTEREDEALNLLKPEQESARKPKHKERT